MAFDDNDLLFRKSHLIFTSIFNLFLKWILIELINHQKSWLQVWLVLCCHCGGVRANHNLSLHSSVRSNAGLPTNQRLNKSNKDDTNNLNLLINTVLKALWLDGCMNPDGFVSKSHDHKLLWPTGCLSLAPFTIQKSWQWFCCKDFRPIWTLQRSVGGGGPTNDQRLESWLRLSSCWTSLSGPGCH